MAKNIQNLLRDGRVDKDATKEIYHLDESKVPDIIQELKFGDVLLGDGHIYVLIAEDGTKEVVIGNSSDTYDSAFKVSASSNEPTTVSWDNIENKPETFAPTIGTTEDTAKAGNWTPSAEDMPNLPLSKIADLTQGNFLIGGASGNEQRKILPADIGLTANNTVAVRNSSGNFQELATSSSAENSTIPVRTPTGQGKFTPSVNDDEAVVQSQFQSGLESKVDKVTGEGLTPEKFTSDEKSKLAGLEDVHYKGWFTSLAALQSAYPAPEEGSHALVDDVSGSLVYIWKTDVEPPVWEAKVGESTEITPAQVKSYYESNPDTNAFTDARRDKLDSITSIFTSALKTVYDNAVNWISTNGQLLIDHLSNTSNPHNVTAEQIGLGDVNQTLNQKQDTLVSGTNIKTVAGQSLLGTGNIDISGLSPLISSTVQDGVTINEYGDRIEYLTKIQAPSQTIGTGAYRYSSHTSTVRLPVGVSISGADWAEISIKNSNRALDVCVYDNSSRYIALGYFNNYNSSASTTANPTVFIKLINYK